MSSSVIAPVPPGRIGAPVDAIAASTYLTELGAWVNARHAELDQLDRAALASPTGAEVTPDIALSMALWQLVSDRYAQLRNVWDSGRIGPAERERLSSLIWGRLDATLDPTLLARSSAPVTSTTTAGALAVSLPEACRLSDALAGQLRVRLGLALSGLEANQRIRDLRAQLERIRDQINIEPAGSRQQEAAQTQARLARRLKEIVDKAGRGGDVGGLLAPLEAEATTFERDLIVQSALRRQARDTLERCRGLRTRLQNREQSLHALVHECLAAVDPAPRLAVPDVEALGPVPNVASALPAYEKRLQRVERAMAVAEDAYRAALQSRQDLLARLQAYRAKADATGLAADHDVAQAYALAAEALQRRPTRMMIAEQLVALYQTYLQTGTAQSAPPVRSARPRSPG